MSNQTVTQTHMLQLLETGDLIPVRDSEQQAAAQACFRGRLLGDMLDFQDNFVHSANAGAAAFRRQIF